MSTVLVTGATGFLGERLVGELRGRRRAVRALVRAGSDTRRLRREGVALREVSYDDARSLEAALEGVEAVAHCVGGGRFRRLADLYAGNTKTTASLVVAVRRSRPDLRRFVLVSSLAGHGPSRDGRARPDSAPAAPVSHYGRSKARAEEILLEHRELFPVTILRPPVIYGPGDTRMLPMFRAARKGHVPLPAASRTASLVYVDDCVRALADLLEKEHASGSAFSVDDGGPHTWECIVAAIGVAVGREGKVLRVPLPALQMAAAVSETVGRLRGKRVFLSRDKVLDAQQAHWVCDSSPLREAVGWVPRVGLEEGMRRTADWYRREGLL